MTGTSEESGGVLELGGPVATLRLAKGLDGTFTLRRGNAFFRESETGEDSAEGDLTGDDELEVRSLRFEAEPAFVGDDTECECGVDGVDRGTRMRPVRVWGVCA